jgi:hypothetical protein
MICTEERLERALSAYKCYKPTASDHLVRARWFWLPVVIEGRTMRRRVRRVAEKILKGQEYLPEYMALPLEHRLGVCLCLMVSWSEHLWEMLQGGAKQETVLTGRVFEHLDSLPVGWQAICVRSWSSTRDGGRVPAMKLIQGLRLTRVAVLMQVYVAIRREWDRVGLDWDRRAREEAALRAAT